VQKKRDKETMAAETVVQSIVPALMAIATATTAIATAATSRRVMVHTGVDQCFVCVVLVRALRSCSLSYAATLAFTITV
jgi:hypothetical protein